MCQSSLSSSKGVAKSLTRVSFGLTLLLTGVAYYLKMESFSSLMNEGFANTQVAFLGPVTTYALPALMIIGGFLYTMGFLMTIGAWAAGIALGLFPVLMMLKAVVSPQIDPAAVMPFVIYGLAFLVVFIHVSKKGCCGSGCACTGGHDHGMGAEDDYEPVKSPAKKIQVRKTKKR